MASSLLSAPPHFPSFPSTKPNSIPNHPFHFLYRPLPPTNPAALFPNSPPSHVPNSSSYSCCPPPRRFSDSLVCHCGGKAGDFEKASSGEEDDGGGIGWEALKRQFGKYGEPLLKAGRRFQDYLNQYLGEDKEEEVAEEVVEEVVEEWDWERWQLHFKQMEEQERIVSVLKAQLRDAIRMEDYEEAAKLKVAVAAAAANDTVGKSISSLSRAIKEERYRDAACIRDQIGASLLGWWVGFSEDSSDPYGRIVHISAAHGRYIAKTYSSRQLATSSPGVPVFEVFIAVNENGEYIQQPVYLQKPEVRNSQAHSATSTSMGSGDKTLENISAEGADELTTAENIEDIEDDSDKDDDEETDEGLSDVFILLKDIIPAAKDKVLKVVVPEKVDRDVISKVFEQIMDEEDEEKDADLEVVESPDGMKTDDTPDVAQESSIGSDDVKDEQNRFAVKVVIGGLMQKLSSMKHDVKIRVPAKLDRTDRSSFLFNIEKDDKHLEVDKNSLGSSIKGARRPLHKRISLVSSDVARALIRGEKVAMKDFLNLALSQVQSQQSLSGSTVFHRLEIPRILDPLNGLYIGAHGPYSSEVIHLRSRYGQWKEESDASKSRDLEFYEYVEALKVTGDPYVPAGQVAFRAKVGKQYQLPHKGILPEEFGMIARYKGQGRLAEPGFKNPRWVDGELVILDGKHMETGPMIGFVYWAPESHFLVFFNRLRLEE